MTRIGVWMVEASLAEHVCPVFWHADLFPFLDRALRHLLLGFHLWEEEHLLDECLARHEHDETVDTDADARCRRHTILECAQEVLVDDHRLVVALVGQFHLVDEALFLVDRVVELRVCVGQLLAVDHEFEALGESWLRAVHLGEWRHLHRIVGDKGRLDEGSLAELSEELVDEFALAHGLVYVHSLLLAEVAYFLLGLSVAVEACLLLDGVEDRQTAVRCLEAYDVAVDLALWLAVDSDTDGFEQLLSE